LLDALRREALLEQARDVLARPDQPSVCVQIDVGQATVRLASADEPDEQLPALGGARRRALRRQADEPLVEDERAHAQRRSRSEDDDQGNDGQRDREPAASTRLRTPRIDVRREHRALALERRARKGELAWDLDHLSADLSSSISTSLCRVEPSSSVRAARA